MCTMLVPDQLSLPSFRGTIQYQPGDPTEESATASQRPISDFTPRVPRPRYIRVVRFPADYVEPVAPPTRRLSRSRIEVTNLASRENAKRVLGSVFSPFTSNPAAPASSAASARSITPDIPEIARPPDQHCAPPPAYDTPPTTSLERGSGGEDNAMAAPYLARSLHNLQNLPASRSVISLVNQDQPQSAAPAASRPAHTPLPDAEKPIASANGISCSIVLAEPHVYLTGFDHDGRGFNGQNSTAMIRGKLVLNVQKSVKIKAVTLTFYGKARTEWPEGIPPEKNRFYEEERLRYQVLPFYNALYANSDEGYGAQCNYVLRNKEASASNTSLALINNERPSTPQIASTAPSTRSSRSSTLLSTKEQKRLSLQSVQSRSFQKSEPPMVPTPQQKGFKVFHPGVYEYSFEISLNHTCPETMDLPLGSVHWMMEALVERAGTFKPNLHGVKEILVIRAPDQNSLEQVEPIAISRKWEDQLHYDIVISGKSFPLGSKIPIAFKLTPLAKVQCHRIKVFVTENIEYFCMDKKITRKDAQRKILLFERQAGKPLAKEYETSEIRTLAGGELSEDQRAGARAMAEKRREIEAARENRSAEPLPAPSDNLLGDLDLGLEHLISQTEIEMEVQLPTCATMRKEKARMIHPDTTWKNIQVHHWIKIVMRLSRLDTEDPSGTKRRHFEISIDSPFHILSCLATRERTALPQYTDVNGGGPSRMYDCGCPNATATMNISPASSSGSVPTLETFHAGPSQPSSQAMSHSALPPLTIPPQAHLSGISSSVQRPMHMLRNPSYNPPNFEEDEPPPPLNTPPPMYDIVVGTPSVDGLADYFARLAEYEDDHTDDESEINRTTTRTGRVNVLSPRTPGGRATSRSMDIDRDFMFRPEAFSPRLQNERNGQGTPATMAT